jgi:hypothetical protein
MVPEEWLARDRAEYREYLLRRLEAPRAWMENAADAQALSV